VRDVVDDSGAVLNHVVYDAFGGVTSQTNASVVFRYGYTARELDAESGLQYNRARYLDSFTGKFISEDPISFQGGDFNLSRYVFNSPITHLDPDGLRSRELSALFTNSYFSKSTVLIYNDTLPNISAAYAIAAAWFDAITTGELGEPEKPPSRGSLVFRNLKDDRVPSLVPARAGKANLRSFSTSFIEGLAGLTVPTIDLKKDDLKRTHGTLQPYTDIEEVKFGYKVQDKAPMLCRYIPQNVEEEDERSKAHQAVRNKILSSPPTPTQEPSRNFTLPDFSFPNIIPFIPLFNPFERAGQPHKKVNKIRRQ
jgi:RHS repeat-associated protein